VSELHSESREESAKVLKETIRMKGTCAPDGRLAKQIRAIKILNWARLRRRLENSAAVLS
jgi:hypothetical protein